MTIHGCVVAGSARAVLLIGASGAGKSALALDLIARGASLVADDRVALHADDGRLIATAPDPLRGVMEVRGVGLVRMTCIDNASVSLVVDLDTAPLTRLPEPLAWTHSGITLPRIAGCGVAPLSSLLHLWLGGSVDSIGHEGARHG